MLSRIRQLVTPKSALAPVAPERQAGAIPYSIEQGQMVFLIVTSRRSGRWIFPKGALRAKLSPPQIAAREAYQEGGVEGEVEPEPIGAYRTIKVKALQRVPIEVDMYPLRVRRQLQEWPEQNQRYRHWVILPDAKRLLSEPRLYELAEMLSRRELAPGAG